MGGGGGQAYLAGNRNRAQGRQERKNGKPLRETRMKPIHKHVTRFWSEERSLAAFLILLIVEIFVLAPLQITGFAFRLINAWSLPFCSWWASSP